MNYNKDSDLVLPRHKSLCWDIIILCISNVNIWFLKRSTLMCLYFPAAPPVQQEEEQMDYGAATPDPSGDATLLQVNTSCQLDRGLSRCTVERAQCNVLTLCVRVF